MENQGYVPDGNEAGRQNAPVPIESSREIPISNGDPSRRMSSCTLSEKDVSFTRRDSELNNSTACGNNNNNNNNKQQQQRSRWSLPNGDSKSIFSFAMTATSPLTFYSNGTEQGLKGPDLVLYRDNLTVVPHTKEPPDSLIKVSKLQWARRVGLMNSTVRQVLLIYPLIIFGLWALVYILWGSSQAFPGGSLFGLIVLEVCSIALGKFVDSLRIPPALGMLAAGLILRNVAPINVVSDLAASLSGSLRAISIVILLSRGALSVNLTIIRKHWKVICPLAFFSCVFEALVGTTAVYFILNFSVPWSALMGCILSAMSGLIVMPYLIALDSSCSEERKKVLIIAKNACGLDAILAICMAEFALGFIFSRGDVSEGLAKGVGEVVMGGVFGLFWGSVVGLIFDDSHGEQIQTFALVTGGIMGLLGLTKIGYPRGGPLGTFAGVLVASTIWKRRAKDGHCNCNTVIAGNYVDFWFFFQPLLFGIIGSRTDLLTVDWIIVAKGILCLAISLSGRILIALVLTGFDDLTWRQRAFLAVAWIPKGTVQAALGPVALDTARDLGFGLEAELLGYRVMNIAVATIVIGSSLGSICMMTIPRRLLTKRLDPC